MKTTIIIATIFIALAIGMTPSIAFAQVPNGGVQPEVIKLPPNGVWLQEVQVPFESTGMSCNLIEEGTVYMCIFYAGDIEAIELIEDEVEIGIPTDPEPEVIDVDLNGVMSQTQEEEEPTTTGVVDSKISYLEELEASGQIKPSEMEVLRLLKAAKVVCELGVEEWEDIQTYAYFDIPKEQVDITRSFNYDRNHLLSSIARLIESCEHVIPYGEENLGQEYLNRIDADKQAVEDELKRLSDLQAKSWDYDSALTVLDFIEQEEKANRAFCESTLYQDSTKANYGCLDIEESPNRGGYTNPLLNPIYQQYLQSKDTGVMILNDPLFPDVHLSPFEKAKAYYNAYGTLPEEVIQNLSTTDIRKLLELQQEEEEGETP